MDFFCPKFAQLQRARSPLSDIRSWQKTYLEIAGDEICRLRYVLNEKVKCKILRWTDENLDFQKMKMLKSLITRKIFFGNLFFQTLFYFRKLYVRSYPKNEKSKKKKWKFPILKKYWFENFWFWKKKQNLKFLIARKKKVKKKKVFELFFLFS